MFREVMPNPVVFSLLLLPEWLVEGMAYSLSADPRQPLSEPWEKHRTRFDAWLQKVGKDGLWSEVRKH